MDAMAPASMIETQPPSDAAKGAVPDGGAHHDTDTPAPVTTGFVAGWWILGFSVAAVLASALQIGMGVRDHGFYLLTLCFLICAVAAWLDVATRLIPNRLTYPAILIGLALNVLLPPLLDSTGLNVAVVWLGATGFQDGLLGFGLCAVIGLVSFAARGLGGGDVKLLGAVGALIGLHAVVPVLFNTLLIAAIIGMANWALKGTLMARLQVVAGNLLVVAATRGGLRQVYPFGRSEAPFGLALLAGLILAQFFAVHEMVLKQVF